MVFPLKNFSEEIPEGSHPGAFASVRKFDIHTGIDLYCADGDSVYSMEAGEVLRVIKFTGEHADTPWWNDTWAILVKGKSGVILYGEIYPEVLNPGDKVEEGQKLGKVTTVLRKDKGLPVTMLHLELYSKDVLDAVVWDLNSPKPEGLEDPTFLLKRALE